MTRRELEITNPEEIKKILDESKVLRLGLIDDGMPYIVPMNYGYTFENGRLVVYLHSGTKGYKLDVIKKNNNCCFEMECEVVPFAGKIPCQFGMSYYSLMGRGKIYFVDDVAEKQKAMSLLMKTQTGKDFEFNERLVSAVTVMRMEIDVYTAKHRPLPKVDLSM